MDNEGENQGIITISIDTELAWGFINYPDHPVLKMLREDRSAGRDSVNFMLDLFNKNEVPVTWAIVGHLFLNECDGEHLDMPRYKSDWYKCDPGTNLISDPLYYGTDIVEAILSSPIEHEIAAHTFSHVPFSMCNKCVADAEIKKTLSSAKQVGVNIKTFVYPETKIGHIDLLRDNGIKVYRGPNLSTNSNNGSVCSIIVNRFTPPAVTNSSRKNGMLEVPGSMHFGDLRFPFLLVPKYERAIKNAINQKKSLNIILHCWSMLLYKNNKRQLEKLLKIIHKYESKEQVRVSTLGNLCESLA
jgi:peptidoglycan/xylan/chitin deacetylase (PgdA/CDA1 family)